MPIRNVDYVRFESMKDGTQNLRAVTYVADVNQDDEKTPQGPEAMTQYVVDQKIFHTGQLFVKTAPCIFARLV